MIPTSVPVLTENPTAAQYTLAFQIPAGTYVGGTIGAWLAANGAAPLPNGPIPGYSAGAGLPDAPMLVSFECAPLAFVQDGFARYGDLRAKFDFIH